MDACCLFVPFSLNNKFPGNFTKKVSFMSHLLEPGHMAIVNQVLFMLDRLSLLWNKQKTEGSLNIKKGRRILDKWCEVLRLIIKDKMGY